MAQGGAGERMAILDDIPNGVAVKLDAWFGVTDGKVLYRDEADHTPVVNIAGDYNRNTFPVGLSKQTPVIDILE